MCFVKYGTVREERIEHDEVLSGPHRCEARDAPTSRKGRPIVPPDERRFESRRLAGAVSHQDHAIELLRPAVVHGHRVHAPRILALTKSAKDLPSTNVVQRIGR